MKRADPDDDSIYLLNVRIIKKSHFFLYPWAWGEINTTNTIFISQSKEKAYALAFSLMKTFVIQNRYVSFIIVETSKIDPLDVKLDYLYHIDINKELNLSTF